MQDEDDRRSRGSRAGRRARGDGPPPADDVLARLGIRAAEDPDPDPWLEQDDVPRRAPDDFSDDDPRDPGGYGAAAPRNSRNRDGAGLSGGAPWSGGQGGSDEQPRGGGYGGERSGFDANSAARNGHGSPSGAASGYGATPHGAGQYEAGRGGYGSGGSGRNGNGPAGDGRNGSGVPGGRAGSAPVGSGWNGAGVDGYGPSTGAPTGRAQGPRGRDERRQEQPGVAGPPRASGDPRGVPPRRSDISDATATTGIRAQGSHERGSRRIADHATGTVGVPTGSGGPPARPPNGVPADPASTVAVPTRAAGAQGRGPNGGPSDPTTGPSRRPAGSAAPPTARGGARRGAPGGSPPTAPGATPPTAPGSAGRPATPNAPGVGQPNRTGPPSGTGPQPPLPPTGTGPQPPLPPTGTGPQPPLPRNGSTGRTAPTANPGTTPRPGDSTTRLRAHSGPDTPGRPLRTPRGDDTALVPPVDDEQADGDDNDSLADRTRAIDASLTRLTAAHAGVDLDDEDGETHPDTDEDEDEAPRTRRADRRAATETDTPAKPPSRLAVAGRVTAAALALLTFLGVALSWGATRWMDSTIRTVAALDPEAGVIDAKGQAGDDNVLVLGTASGSSGTPAATGERTDTLMLAHVAAGGDRVVGVSFPMDLEINRPPCPRWDPAAATYLDETVPAETRTALSSAYAVGGPRCLVRTVQQLTGMSVTRFVALDLPGIAGMVDAIRGVDVCVEQPVDDRTLGTVIPRAGTTRLDGAQAVRFAEAASVPTDPSPALGQLQRQQRLLAATFREALSASTLLSPTTTRDVAAALGRSLLADDVGVHEMVRLTSALDRPSADGVTFLPLPVSAVPNTRGNLELRDTESSRLFSALRKDQPLPTTTTPVASAEGPKPADVTVGVVNAAGRDGLGRQVGDALRSLGFGVGEVGNASQPAAETVLRFSPDRADAAELLGEVVPGARLVQDPGSTGTLQLVLGSSFDGTVRAPVTDAAAPAAQAAPTASCG